MHDTVTYMFYSEVLFPSGIWHFVIRDQCEKHTGGVTLVIADLRSVPLRPLNYSSWCYKEHFLWILDHFPRFFYH